MFKSCRPFFVPWSRGMPMGLARVRGARRWKSVLEFNGRSFKISEIPPVNCAAYTSRSYEVDRRADVPGMMTHRSLLPSASDGDVVVDGLVGMRIVRASKRS